MPITTFAAIDIGSYDVCMRIYEISRKFGIRKIDDICSRLELGKDTYVTGKIKNESVEELCKILHDYTNIMKEYQVSGHQVCSTSSLREAKNVWLVVEKVYQSTGLTIEILSNSEQRFLGYKSIASKEAAFTSIIQKGTAILEVGGGSVQVSLFDNDALVTTQNFKLGNLRIREKLLSVEKETIYYEQLVRELINNEIITFKKLHLKEQEIKNVILLGDNMLDGIMGKGAMQSANNTIEREAFLEIYERVVHYSPEQIAVDFGIPLEYASLLVPSIIIYKTFIEVFGAQTMWLPGTQLTDGMAYAYAEANNLIKTNHNFENDIIAAAKNIAKRYGSSKNHTQAMTKIALAIFDSMKKVHGMGQRERLLLQIAVLLHDCGKYISFSNVASCSYNIIMFTEIIGLSHREREIVANAVRFNTTPYIYFKDSTQIELDRMSYMLVGKLTAILRISNALDRSHLQKIKEIKAVIREKDLILTIDTERDFTLEEGLLGDKADFFEEVFSIRPRLRRKKYR